MATEIDHILKAAAVPLVLIDRAGTITGLSPPAEHVLGQSTLGRHFSGIFRSPEFVSQIEAALSGAAPGRAAMERQVNGRNTVLHATISPLDNGGALVTLIDVTAELAAGRSRSEFVANVSHELRTPLTAITGAIETLQTSARSDPEAQAIFLDMMAREAGRMNRLVQDLLSLSRVENEGARRYADVDICTAIRAAMATLDEAAKARGVTVEIEGCDVPRIVRGDPDQMRQVFLNLIENAVKYGHENETVTVSLSEPGPQTLLGKPGLRVDVIDQGDGIAEEYIARLTERFFRVDTHRSRETGGTGLGLAIVKYIVASHGGRLRITSELGKGSCFSVFLPLAKNRAL